jgi:5-methylcytosine-specific restriction protein A
MRSVPEWIGKTDDAKVPPRVRLRIWEKHEGRCHITGIKILPGVKWELEHVVALCNGGEHRESNLAPALAGPHKIKTKADRREQARSRKRRMTHAGIKSTTYRWGYGKNDRWKKKITGEVVPR